MSLTSEKISDEFYGNNSFSYGGKYRLYDHYKEKQVVDEALEKNEIYSLFKQHKKAQKYSPILVYGPRKLWQADVAFFRDKDFIEANNGFQYLLTIIDTFTKYAWVYPLKQNTCTNVLNCFKDLFEKVEKPLKLNTDRGSELMCKKFEAYLKDNKIHHYVSYSLRKCPIVERFNLTIKRILYQMMARNNTFEWVKFLDAAMKIYLSRKHKTIKMSPENAEKPENESKVRQALWKYYSKSLFKPKKASFRVNDNVRIFMEKGTFDRGYYEQFSREHFTIEKVLSNLPVPRYILKDYSGELIKGAFFEDELVKYKPTDYYPIKILGSRKRKGEKEKLVHYIGWSPKWDQWVKEKDLKDLL